MSNLTPFGVGFMYGAIIGASVALALVVLAVYVRLEWRAHSDELERSWQRERGGE